MNRVRQDELVLSSARHAARSFLPVGPSIPERDSASAGPFLKWAGGKSQLLVKLEAFFPGEFNRYFEPFVGSGAVFFFLRRKHGGFPATLIDSNEELLNCFDVVKRGVDELLPLLKRHQNAHCEDYYYEVRKKGLGQLSPVQRAARLIYLNKTCYNGLYRVNNGGQFNVPIGSYKQPNIFHEQTLRAASSALKNTRLLPRDFSAVLDLARRGDFVYFDPPYYTESSGFTGYAVTPSGRAEFGPYEHRRLFNVVKALHARGCRIVLSNSDTGYIRALYKSFSITTVKARRFINCDGAGRQPVDELVITNR